MYPPNLVKTGAGYLMILLTKRGGHVGWPLGLNARANKWQWMNDAAKHFVDAVVRAKESMQH